MKEKEKKAQESVYLRIEKRVLAYSVTSDASRRRDASVFYLAKHRDAIRRDASCHSLHYWNKSDLIANWIIEQLIKLRSSSSSLLILPLLSTLERNLWEWRTIRNPDANCNNDLLILVRELRINKRISVNVFINSRTDFFRISFAFILYQCIVLL